MWYEEVIDEDPRDDYKYRKELAIDRMLDEMTEDERKEYFAECDRRISEQIRKYAER